MFVRSLGSGCALVISLALFGCAANAPKSEQELLDQRSTQITKANELAKAGKTTEAQDAYRSLAKNDPDWKEPWVKLAKAYFDEGKYSQAIVAAEEALQRDKGDRVAKSICVVAGLRVATESVKSLRNDVELKGNAKNDAANLARVMRETLGEDVLVPDNTKKPHVKKTAAQRTATTSKNGEGSSSGGNPFGSLR